MPGVSTKNRAPQAQGHSARLLFIFDSARSARKRMGLSLNAAGAIARHELLNFIDGHTIEVTED